MNSHWPFTRQQLAERRLKGGQLLAAGRLSQAEIARRLGVSRATVCAWAKQLETGGLPALRRRKPPGRPRRLTDAQQQQLVQRLQAGARASGFPTERWTIYRAQALIQREFGVRFHVNYINRLLAKLGWSWRAQRVVQRRTKA